MMNRLNFHERLYLEGLQKVETNRHTLDRIRSILLKDKGWCSLSIAEALFIHQTTVDRYLRDYESNGKIRSDYKGRKERLKDEHSRELADHIQDSCYRTSKEIAFYAYKKYRISFSDRGMRNWLERHNFSYKKPKKVPYKAQKELQEEFIDDYNTLLNEASVNQETVLFVDSTHPSQETSVSYGWIKKGFDKLVPSHGGRKRMNICGALDLETMDVVYEEFETINQESFIKFLTKLRQTYSRKVHIILDQAGYHTARSVQKFAQENNVKLHYLPPHSPNLNPIERLWKYMKETIIYNKFYPKFSLFKQAIHNFFIEHYPKVKNSLISQITDNFKVISF
jgi:transposase